MKILNEKTDETHSITMPELIASLESYGISAERKSVYSDIELLRDFGMDIIGEQRDKSYYYHVGSRNFELAELKLLVDSVSSARFITEKKSHMLIKKIESLASVHEAGQLQRQVYVTERVKSENEQILYTIDAIHKAIAENSRIKFQYFNWNEKKEKVLRHDGDWYEMSPWALTLSDENYYLVCFDSQSSQIKYFRVDKMLHITLTGHLREGQETFRQFDIASYAKKRFRMYDGEETSVVIQCKNAYAGVIIDMFGKDVLMHKVDEDSFRVVVPVAVSNQFLAWVLSMSEGMQIVGPQETVDRVKEFVENLHKLYH